MVAGSLVCTDEGCYFVTDEEMAWQKITDAWRRRQERKGRLMPKQYTAMRDKFIQKGMTPDKAKEKAAKIYNASGKGHVGKGSK